MIEGAHRSVTKEVFASTSSERMSLDDSRKSGPNLSSRVFFVDHWCVSTFGLVGQDFKTESELAK